MNREYDRGYEEGGRCAARQVLRETASRLCGEDAKMASLVIERDDTRATLRRICAEYGDNDWTDSLYLVDVIEKHLEVHLDSDLDPPPRGYEKGKRMSDSHHVRCPYCDGEFVVAVSDRATITGTASDYTIPSVEVRRVATVSGVAADKVQRIETTWLLRLS